MKRSKHSLSHYKLLTADMGVLLPVAWFEALPGDTIQQATSMLIRVSPLLAPVMHPVSVRVHHWFVPNRLIWTGWEDFITGGQDGAGDGTVWPHIANPTYALGTIQDYFGLPTGVALGNISALPIRAYSLIVNEFYADQDLVTPLPLSKASGADATTTTTTPFTIAWEKDYFTSARPWPQKGAAVTLPLGTQATVRTSTSNLVTGAQEEARFRNAATGGFTSSRLGLNASGELVSDTSAGFVAGATQFYPENLYADLASATAVNVTQVREAFALQRYKEARAIYGSRYSEYLRYLGVRPSDARLQRPEYLGGGKQTISFSEVLQSGTNFDANLGVGTLRGHGISALRSRRYRRFFEEHGIVMSLLSVRPRTMYFEGVGKEWTRDTKESYFQKELELIGQDEVLNKEIYAAGASPNNVFGYQDRYSDYKHLQSGVAGDFRTTLNFWHMARDFAAAPTLNASFVGCDATTRIYASTSTDPLWIMCNHSIQARRQVGKRAVGRVM